MLISLFVSAFFVDFHKACVLSLVFTRLSIAASLAGALILGLACPATSWLVRLQGKQVVMAYFIMVTVILMEARLVLQPVPVFYQPMLKPAPPQGAHNFINTVFGGVKIVDISARQASVLAAHELCLSTVGRIRTAR